MDEGGEVFAAVTFRRLRRQAAPGFCGDVKLFLSLLFESGEQPFAAAIAINIGGVEEVHPAVERCVERGERFFVIHVAPRTANGPRPKTDFGNSPAGSSESAIVHVEKLGGKGVAAKRKWASMFSLIVESTEESGWAAPF